MAHLRTQIRDAIQTLLTGLPTTGSNVFAGRALPLTAGKTPALVIFTFPDVPVYEDGAEMGDTVCIVQHDLTVEVEGYASDSTDDKLDQIALEVEQAMYTDERLGGLAQGIRLAGQDAARDGAGARIEGAIVMQFIVSYLAAEGDPETPQ